MKQSCLLALSVLLLTLIISGCGGEVPNPGSNLSQPETHQQPSSTGNLNSPTDAGSIVPINVLADQLIANPEKFFGQTVSLGSLITDIGAGYVLFGKIKVVADLVPAVRINTSATIIGVCQGTSGGYVLLTDSIIIPSCEVA